MKFILFVEGDTEKDVLPDFFKRCVEPELNQNVGVQAVNFHGWANLWREAPKKAEFYLQGPGACADIIAVISILDLYGPSFYPTKLTTSSERGAWVKAQLEKQVNHKRYRHFSAVHELEAWLFSQPASFPKEVIRDVDALSATPETVNFDSPPKRRLDSIYEHRLKRGYQQRVDGAKLFRALRPAEVRSRCPKFSAMIDEMLLLARAT